MSDYYLQLKFHSVMSLFFSLSGSCILQVWDHGAALHPCKCPLCRREITLLVPSEAALRRHDMDEVAEILLRIERYNRLYGQRSEGLMQVVEL